MVRSSWSIGATLWGVVSALLVAISQKLDGPLQYFVFPLADTLDCRPSFDVWDQPDPLKLTSVGVPNIVSGERDGDAAW